MNQARKRPMHQKVLSMILVLVMLLGLLSVSAFTMQNTTSSDSADSTEFMRIFHLDCGRKYFSVSEIEGIIDQLAENHYTHLQLAFGNDGLRFLLDDMSVTVNGTEYKSDNVTRAIKRGNEKLTSGSSGELSESNMDDIISYAKGKGIQIIPMFNAPGHMYTAVNAMTSLEINGKINKVSTLYDGRTSNWAVDPTDATAVEFAEALLQKYVAYFSRKGSTMFNIGADESGLKIDTDESGITTTNYPDYAKMVNGMNKIVKNAGMTTLAYNDGIYNTAYAASQKDVEFDKDIVICYWTSGANSASVESLLEKGFKILNNSDNWYYVLGDYLYNDNVWGSGGQWGYKDALNGIKSTPVTQMKDYTGAKKPIGSILCVWCDGPAMDYSSYKTQVCNLIKAMADANPTYFTDKVKLPATDTDDQVSVVVTGTKGQTATVDAEPVTSKYQFDVDAGNVVSYNVTPMVAGQNYTAQGTVTLPVPTGWVQDASRIRAYIIDNGAVKLLSGTLAGGKYTFDVPHFSEMGLLQVDATVVPISVAEGKTVQKTVDGNQTVVDKSQLDETIATVTTESKPAGKTLKEVTSIESGKEYLIYNQRYEGVLTNSTVKSQWNSCLALEKATVSADNANVWTITASGSNYRIADKNGKNLTVGEDAASVGTTKANLTLTYNQENRYWNISKNSYYLNNLGATNNAGGWKNSAAPTDSGSKWTIYQIVEEASDSTTISFTGVKAGGTTYVTVGDTTYAITVTEKQTVEIPISIVDYRADGLLFDYTYLGNSYAYGLVHVLSGNGNYNFGSVTLGQTLDGANYGTKINGTTLERTRTTGDVSGLWGDDAKNDNSWSRAGLVKSELGSNGMPVYTEATVEYVAGLLSSGNYNAMSGNRNTVLQNTFLVYGAQRSVLGTPTNAFSEAFRDAKTYDNISTAYDLAWYLLNTIYQPDTNMTTVNGTDGHQHNVPIYGMGVDTYSSIVLTDDGDGKYSFNAGYTGNVKNVLYDRTNGTISESSNGQVTTGFYPIDGLGYEQSGLLSETSAINGGVNNGSFALRGESQFVYEHAKELYFTFTGDDDVYMYINGKLALDLGGAHGRNTKTVKLNDLNAEEYGLKEGQVATFTFFYMERCSDASTFGIETNMELVKRGINVQKNAYDAGYANEIMSGTAVETGRSVYYDLVVTNQSNALMNHICFSDTDSRGGTASFGFGVTNAAVTAGTTKTDGTVSLGAAGTYEIYVTDANNAEVAETRQTFSSLSELSDAVAAVELQPGQSLHVRFLTATFTVDKSKILNYVNTLKVTAFVANQQLSDDATNELYSYNANDTSKTYVVDFGLPLQITGIFDSGAKENIGNVKLNDSNRLKYGTVVLTSAGYNSSLVYTRTDDKAINDAETIVLDVTYKMGKSNVTLQKTLTIIPATSVYYEDSFATFTNANGTKNVAQVDNVDKGIWTKVTDGTTQTNVNQALEALGGTTNTKNVYGYDPAYAGNSKFSMGSATKVTVAADTYNEGETQWPTATFTFKGTGFDVISLTDNTSGTIFVTVTNKATRQIKKRTTVNNYYGYKLDEDGKWVTSPNNPNCLYQIPVIKIAGLDYAEYEVKIQVAYASFLDETQVGEYSFWLDAIRVYDPMGKDNNTYTQDNEGYPQYIKLHDAIVGQTAGIQDTVFVDGGAKATLAEYKNYGPNNEVYLTHGQAISFKLTGDLKSIASVQIGAKTPNGTGKAAKISVNDQEVKTATEMYYAITDAAKGDRQVTIANNGDGILSLTNLKITYTASGKSVSLAPLTTADQENAVAQVRALFAAPAEPFLPDRFKASWGHAVRKGDTATLTVKASEDVEAITVDGQTITAYTPKTERTGWGWWAKTVTYREFTYTDTAVETKDYTVCAVNSDGVSSDPITAKLTVRPSIRDWWHGIFDKWF